MSEEPVPIAYTALQPGAAVQSRDGEPFGTVTSVLVVEDVDVFDGLVVETAAGTRFVDADQVDRIFTTHVLTTLSAEEAAGLPEPEAAPVYGVDARAASGGAVGGIIDRLLGRGTWKRKQ